LPVKATGATAATSDRYWSYRSHKQQIVVLETPTTDTGATGAMTTGRSHHWSHERQIPEHQQIQESGAMN